MVSRTYFGTAALREVARCSQEATALPERERDIGGDYPKIEASN